MPSQGLFAASLIDASSRGLAAGAVARLAEANADEVEAWGFGQLAADAEVRLQYLAEALAVGHAELVHNDLRWLASTYAARDVPVAFLERNVHCLREELSERLPADAARLACSYLDGGLAGLAETPPGLPTHLVDGAPHVALARSFLASVLAGRRDEAERAVLEAFDAGATASELHTHVLGAAQAEVGRLWQIGSAHAAQEHLASRIVEDALTLLRERAPRAPDNGRSVLIASVRGNLHEIGARIVADRFEQAGWRSLFLGADTPTEDLVASIAHFDADLVALSAGLGLNVRASAELVQAIHAAHPGVPVLVGGGPFNAVPDLWRTIGAEGCAHDAAGAVALGESMM